MELCFEKRVELKAISDLLRTLRMNSVCFYELLVDVRDSDSLNLPCVQEMGG
jgi:hypothetical protein